MTERSTMNRLQEGFIILGRTNKVRYIFSFKKSVSFWLVYRSMNSPLRKAFGLAETLNTIQVFGQFQLIEYFARIC